MSEPTPFPPHLGSEFLLWLWATSPDGSRSLDLPDTDNVYLWVEDRLVFRAASGDAPVVVVTSENAARDSAALAALRDSKRLQQVRFGMRRDGREFVFTLDEHLHVRQAKIPSILSEGAEEAVYDRMALLAELDGVVQSLFRRFASSRKDPEYFSGLLADLLDE